MRIKIALALVSAIFMMIWFPSLIGFTYSPLSIELLSIVSFFGSVLFLLEARKVISRWYLAVPLCVSLFVMVIVNFFIVFNGKSFLKDPISSAEKLVITLMMLLPLFSALVFLSFLRRPDSMNTYALVSYGMNILSLVISCVLSFIAMLFLGFIPELTHSGESLIFVHIYWMFVMPVIGIFFLLSTITYRNPDNILNPIADVPTQKFSPGYIPFVDNFMRIKIALALTSVIFLTMWVVLALIPSHSMSTLLYRGTPELPTSLALPPPHSMSTYLASEASKSLFFNVIILLNVISLLGSVLFLLEARDVLNRWYLAIPLCISLSVLVMVNLWRPFFGFHSFYGPVDTLTMLWIILLALLPLCSAMVFLFLNRRSGSMDIYGAVSSAASILSIFSLLFAYMEIPKWSIMGSAQFPLILYRTILMPIIGICFLVRAITYRNPG